MTTTQLKITKLSASEGKLLTDGCEYVKDVYLPEGEDPSRWYEVDEGDVPQNN